MDIDYSNNDNLRNELIKVIGESLINADKITKAAQIELIKYATALNLHYCILNDSIIKIRDYIFNSAANINFINDVSISFSFRLSQTERSYPVIIDQLAESFSVICYGKESIISEEQKAFYTNIDVPYIKSLFTNNIWLVTLLLINQLINYNTIRELSEI